MSNGYMIRQYSDVEEAEYADKARRWRLSASRAKKSRLKVGTCFSNVDNIPVSNRSPGGAIKVERSNGEIIEVYPGELIGGRHGEKPKRKTKERKAKAKKHKNRDVKMAKPEREYYCRKCGYVQVEPGRCPKHDTLLYVR